MVIRFFERVIFYLSGSFKYYKFCISDLNVMIVNQTTTGNRKKIGLYHERIGWHLIKCIE